MDYLEIIKGIYNSGNLLKTELYNEGWMLRLVLDWFYKHPQCSYEFSKDDKITMKEDTHWFSEGRLESPFKKDKELSIKKNEGYTRADGVYGNIEIGDKGDSDIKLAKDCKQFIVTEAKIFSNYSKGILHIEEYNQAARYIACMYQIVENYRQHYGKTYHDIEEIAFYTFLPKSQIEKKSFIKYTSFEDIEETIEKRIKPYNGKMKEWFKSFTNFLETIQKKIILISWEEIITFISKNDEDYGKMLSDFYDNCIKYNKRSRNSKILEKIKSDGTSKQIEAVNKIVHKWENKDTDCYIEKGKTGLSMRYKNYSIFWLFINKIRICPRLKNQLEKDKKPLSIINFMKNTFNGKTTIELEEINVQDICLKIDKIYEELSGL